MLRLAIYVCPQTVCSSLSLTCDAFGLANQLAGQQLFKLSRFSLDGAAVQLPYAQISVEGGLDLAADADLVLLPATGRDIEATLTSNAALIDWLAARPQSQALASLCSSAFLLAAAGVLDGGHATTHWALAAAFRRRFARVQLDEQALFSEYRNRFCSAGAQAGLDLCLQLIRRHAGAGLAQQVAQTLLVDLHRGQQTRFQPLLPAVHQDDSPFGALLLWLQQHFALPLDLHGLAARLHCSTRTLLRRFKLETGLTPNDYIQRLRIGAAQIALQQPQPALEQVAIAVGYQDRATFARLFKQLCGETPGAFRRRLQLSQHGAVYVPVAAADR